MEVSIEYFRGLSQEEIAESVSMLFQQEEEITITELGVTYGEYIESIEALQEDIATYFAQQPNNTIQEENPTHTSGSTSSFISIHHFAGMTPENIEDVLKELWGTDDEITINELGATYPNTPESIETLKQDILFYFSVKEENNQNRENYKPIGKTLITLLFWFSVIGIIASIICMFSFSVTWGLAGAIQCLIYALFFNYLSDLGDIANNHTERITALEIRINHKDK